MRQRLGRNPERLLLVKWGALNRALREQAVERGVEVSFAKRLVGVDDDDSGVTARFANGSDATGHLLVGCDGIRSATRHAILPDGPAPAYTVRVGTAGSSGCPTGPSRARSWR